MSAHALPRLRTRRRRRRPLSPLGWWALVVCSAGVLNLAVGVTALLAGDLEGALNLVGGAVALGLAWPPLMRELRRMDD